MIRQAIAARALGLAGCATASAPEIPGCRKGPCVHIGETQGLGSLSVTPLAVLEDSRCPIEADCAWEGAFRINARLDLGHETITVELKAWEPFVINGGTLLLAEVAPDPSVQWPKLEAGDYHMRFTFEP